MGFALVFVGIMMIVTGANNNYAALGNQLRADFSGEKSFLLWIAAIGGVGALGYIPQFRKFSHYFMALILLSIILANKGFFSAFVTALKNNGSKTVISVRTPSPNSTGQTLSDISSVAQTAAAFV